MGDKLGQAASCWCARSTPIWAPRRIRFLPQRNRIGTWWIFQPAKNMGISWDAKRFRKTRSLGEHAMGISGDDVAIVHSLPRPWCTKRLAWHPSGPGRWPAADTMTIAGEAPWWIFFPRWCKNIWMFKSGYCGSILYVLICFAVKDL